VLNHEDTKGVKKRKFSVENAEYAEEKNVREILSTLSAIVVSSFVLFVSSWFRDHLKRRHVCY
jgi:hypothetical protein